MKMRGSRGSMYASIGGGQLGESSATAVGISGEKESRIGVADVTDVVAGS